MTIRAQIGMVLNLDKCIGCHTCSITCKNVWTSRGGMEYAWFNNVETKPGLGYPRNWEDQEQWKGGWTRTKAGKLQPKAGGKVGLLTQIFANPNLPEIDDYYDPYTYEYDHLKTAKESKTVPTARMKSVITGKTKDAPDWGVNWEEILGGEFEKRRSDYNFKDIQEQMYGEFENTFMMYLPRLCEHCLNPILRSFMPVRRNLQARRRRHCPHRPRQMSWLAHVRLGMSLTRKFTFNWQSGKSEKCTFCYPRIEAGEPTVCSETCVGRIRYLGVLLYDSDQIKAAASVPDEKDLYQAQCDLFLDPNDPDVIARAKADGIPESWIEGAQNSPVYKMAMDWKIAFPLHPEYRTLPMVWYVPPLSPIQSAHENGMMESKEGSNGMIPDVESLRIPVKYLANLLTAGDEKPVTVALERMLAMRAYMRGKSVDGVTNLDILDQVGMSEHEMDDMYQMMAIANYEDRFVIPTNHKEYAGDGPFDHEIAFETRAECGFSFGNGCHGGEEKRPNLFGSQSHSNTMDGSAHGAKAPGDGGVKTLGGKS